MKTTLNTGIPSQIETECLVVAVTDAAENNNSGDKSEKHSPQIQTDDRAVQDAAADLIASGEVTGKMLEIALLHKPQGLNAKRLLLIGGGTYVGITNLEQPAAPTGQAAAVVNDHPEGERPEELRVHHAERG